MTALHRSIALAVVLISACSETPPPAIVSMECDGTRATDGAGLRCIQAFDTRPDCDPDAPTFECADAMFVPLLEASVPFDAQAVANSLEGAGFIVASGWRATALHQYTSEVGQSELPVSTRERCYLNESAYGTNDAPVMLDGCDDFLAVGGGPEEQQCQVMDIPVWDCVDRGPMEAIFDFAVHRTASRASILPVDGPNSVAVGDAVYLVGRPNFSSLSGDDEIAFLEGWPRVAIGRVVGVYGTSIVTTNLAAYGNSGGPLLNAAGHAIGILSARIGDIRWREGVSGTSLIPVTDVELKDTYSVSTVFDDALRAAIDTAD
ncbi:MAG: serine protease [Polyangiales bacterium]